MARRVCAAGLFLCRCGALWGDLRGGFLVAGVVVRGVLFRGVCGHLVASGGVSCGVSCGGLFVVVSCGVSCGVASVGRFVCRVVWRGVCCSCRVAGRGAARVSPCVSCRCAGSGAGCLFHVEERGRGLFSLCL